VIILRVIGLYKGDNLILAQPGGLALLTFAFEEATT
jgi:hypothetical protein